jgi:hypothetical protein
MANPTSNYGWVLPNSADLVTDLPADFDVALQGVDTTTKALNPSTTLGDMEYRSATANTNTRLPIGTTGQVLTVVGGVPAWSSETGDISAVTAGTGISGGGTSGAVTITNDMATTITTNGDLLYGTGSGTYTRRGIGSTGDVLTVSSGVPTWAAPVPSNSMTSLATGSYTGTALNITGLSTSYNNLIIQLSSFDPSSAGQIQMRFNNDTGNKYFSAASASSAASNFNISYLENLSGIQHATDSRFALYFTLYNYATSNSYKQGIAHTINTDDASTANIDSRIVSNCFNSTTAISQINIFEAAAGTFSINYTIWGVK